MMIQKGAAGVQPPINENKKLFIDDNIGYVELLGVFGNDLTVANAARVSFNKESEMEPIYEGEGDERKIVGEKVSTRDEKLINFLAKYNHVTPFFHPQVQLRIKMPIYVAREWFRSVIGFARNEVSRRYVMYQPECFTPSTLRKRDKDIKQGSSKDPVDNHDQVRKHIVEFNEYSIKVYNDLLEKGVCPEQARGVLPQSMYTEFIETASLSAYARIVHLRAEATAQKEIQDYAYLVKDLVMDHFPVSWNALLDK